MKTLQNLKPHPGSKKSPKRVGRGPGSGHGKTACRGQKGQGARSGGGVPAGFEGGQMPIYRRLPKRGFKNPFRKVYGILNVGDLDKIAHEGVIDLEVAQSKGPVRKRFHLLKILGEGEITRAVTVRAHAASKSARQKIEAAGGTLEIVE
ncbi:50S ribosomal protein L15 [Dissulfurirhabdus thermomarina]|uniref:Large ribosomal subunit protein uL15 n=1 Tax=Dissulfurirhabdus thermomarina TaxID=1765737 RepID=A0A6N9TRW8_DISTH|nr:50S ribosomal protein L15 [Dissulfurirhabdus thermomarina]NDY41326.1 50S ribosomal protein L15 [Dissulfurirhabdus thermomarina]NMX23291.1 50S ribosomal protein L15 [Dissulfurirhabdus thermomarina]